MTLRRVGRAVALATCALGAACSAAAILDGGARDVAGVIISNGVAARVSAPDTITHGVSFDVSFSTFAGGCTRSIAHDDVTMAGSAVEIRPYDRYSGGDTCTSDMIFLNSVLPVRLDTPGSYLIHVIGEQTGSTTGPAEITRPITVR